MDKKQKWYNLTQVLCIGFLISAPADAGWAQEDKKQKIEEARQKKELFKKLSEEEALAVEKLMAPEITLSEAQPATVIYRIDKEDVLDLAVWRHPELSREVIVRPDGMISYPLVGDIEAAGLALSELSGKVSRGLSEFVKKRLKPSISKKPEEKAKYQIANGDTLDISVWGVPDLSREAIVSPDGMISYPLVGNVQATGKALSELDEELTKGLGNYVKDPQVSVMVKSFGWNNEAPAALLEENPEVTVMLKKFGGRKVVVLGEVAKPGVYTFTGNVRLIEALALAGGYTKYALRDNILVIRGDVHKSPQVIVSNISKLFKRADLSQNVVIQPQDIIYVPFSIISNINAFLETISPLIDTIYKSAAVQNSRY